jgi:hypothetical protein
MDEVSFFPRFAPPFRDPAWRANSATLRALMDTQPIKNEMAALRERFSALRGYL